MSKITLGAFTSAAMTVLRTSTIGDRELDEHENSVLREFIGGISARQPDIVDQSVLVAAADEFRSSWERHSDLDDALKLATEVLEQANLQQG